MWVGAGSIGVGDGRIRLLWRDQVPLLTSDPPTDADRRSSDLTYEAIHVALRERLATSGASFWSDLVAAAQHAGCEYDDPTVLSALWDLVWAGEVTNDSLTPVRSLLAGSTPSSPSARSRRGARRGPGRPNLRSLSRLGPPSATGRWSLVEPLRTPPSSATERATTTALQLLERYGVLTREMALAEGGRRWIRRGCIPSSRNWRIGGRCVAATSSPDWGRHSLRCRGPSTAYAITVGRASTRRLTSRPRRTPVAPTTCCFSLRPTLPSPTELLCHGPRRRVDRPGLLGPM